MKYIKSYKKESLFYRIKKENKIKYKKNNFSIKEKIKHNLLSSPTLYYLFKNKPENLFLNNIELSFSNLPKSFHNYKIIFASDLHLDIKPNSLNYIKNLNILNSDILILGGDYFDKPLYNKHDIQDLKKFISLFKSNHKIAVLGNNDTYKIIENENFLDINFLINESIYLEKNNEKIILTGLDDYTIFNSNYLKESLIESNDIFKIAISHNPDFLIDNNIIQYHLQLSGHTHGGQIKLPFINYSTHTKYKKCIKGNWQYKNLKGFTSSGFGCSGYPLRNIKPEIVLITLKCI